MNGSRTDQRSPQAGHRSRQAGFSFVELLVALAILSFAFTYGIIHLDGATAPTKLASAGRQLGSQIEFLRGHAVQQSRPVELQLDLDGRRDRNGVHWSRFRSVRPPDASTTAAEEEVDNEILYTEWSALPKWINIESVQFGENDFASSGILTIRFEAGGEIIPNGFMIRLVSAEILNEDDSAFSVEVNGLTGEVFYEAGRANFDQVIDDSSF